MEDKCKCGDICTCDPCECEDSQACKENCKCPECEEEKPKKKIKRGDKAKIADLEDRLLRNKAEFINYRKRLEEEQARLFKYCNEDIVKEILPIIDNFERAIAMDDNNLDDEVSKFLSGFKMIYCNLINVLKESGVVEIDGNNKPFNPMYHEAIMVEKRVNVEPDMVLEVLQKGYMLKDRVIRPAMVKVSE